MLYEQRQLELPATTTTLAGRADTAQVADDNYGGSRDNYFCRSERSLSAV